MRFNVYAALALACIVSQGNTVLLTDDAKKDDDKKVVVPEFKLDVLGGDCHKVDLSAKAQVESESDKCCGNGIVVNGGVCGCEEDKPLSQRVKEAFCDKDSKCGVDCSWCQAK